MLYNKVNMLTCVAALAVAAGTTSADGHATLKFAPGDDSVFNRDNYEAFAEANDFRGQSLTITCPWTGPDKELVDSVIAYFETATGASIEYSGSDSFEQDIVISSQAGSAPNIGVFPQPGPAADLASPGALTPLPDDTADWIRDNCAAGQSWVDLGTYGGLSSVVATVSAISISSALL